MEEFYKSSFEKRHLSPFKSQNYYMKFFDQNREFSR